MILRKSFLKVATFILDSGENTDVQRLFRSFGSHPTETGYVSDLLHKLLKDFIR